MFTKQTSSLLVFFQGHPEYEETTLLREYRRDVGRFLRGQQAHYPTLPQGYFPPAALELLSAFETRARAAPDAELLADFPLTPIAATLTNTWSAGATGIYRNWLALLASRKKNSKLFRQQRYPRPAYERVAENHSGAGAPHDRIVGLVERILERTGRERRRCPVMARLSELGMSSMKMINLMLAIEVEFDLSIPQAEITPDNFESIASVETLVVRLLGPGI